MYALSFLSTGTISTTLNYNSIMLRWFLSEGTVHFWNPEEFENTANPDLENLKHLQNLGHFSLTASCMSEICVALNFKIWKHTGSNSWFEETKLSTMVISVQQQLHWNNVISNHNAQQMCMDVQNYLHMLLNEFQYIIILQSIFKGKFVLN